MKVLIDTNVFLTYLTRRCDKYSTEVDVIVQMCIDQQLEGFAAFHSLSIIWYLMRHSSLEERLNAIKLICTSFKIAHSDNDSILQALQNTGFSDFEDNLQDCCAQDVNADYIVTANVKDYEGHSSVPAVTPAEILRRLDDPSAYNVDVPDNEVREDCALYGLQAHVPHRHFIVRDHLSCQLCILVA